MAFVSRPQKLALAVAATLAAQTPATLMAQETVLEEVVIYAQKREQTVFEVPVSVSSYGGDALDKAKVVDLNDLSQISPSLSINNTTGAADTSIFIRGTGTSGNNPGFEQSVGVFIDGVFRGRPGSAMSDYVDIEGIEVLKGPQGTLFGRNTSAGVVSVRTSKPSYEPGGSVEVTAGNYNLQQFKGRLSGALIDDVLAASLSGSWQQRDGVMENDAFDEEMYDKDRYSLRGQLLWDINDAASLRVIVDKSESDEVCCGVTPLFYGPSQQVIDGLSGVARLPGKDFNYQGLPGTLRDPFDRKYATNDAYKDEVEDQGISGELNWEFGETALTAIASYRNFKNYQTNDIDHNSADLLSRVQDYDIDETSLEIRWASIGAQEVDWTVGAYFFDQQIDYNSPLYFGSHLRPYFELVSQGLVSVIETNLGLAPGTFFGSDGRSTSGNDYSSESYALFGQATWNIDADLSVILGLRYSDEEKQADFIPDYVNPWSSLTTPQLSAALGGNPALVAQAQALQFQAPYEAFSADYADDNLSATVSINYQIKDDLSVYARYASGYKSGGINMDRDATGATADNPVPNPENVLFDPEQVDAIEVGVKSYLLDNRLQLSATAFYQEVEDFQLQTFVGTSFLVRNAAQIESKGLEVDFSFKPSDRWLINGGLVWQDVTYGEFENGPNTLAQNLAGAPQNSNDLTGERVNQASEFSASVLVAFNYPLNDLLEYTANLSANYNSDYSTEVSNEPLLEQDASLLLNASVGLGSLDGSWSLELWGKNLTDEEIYDGFEMPIQQGTYGAYLATPPRTYGVTAKYNF